MTQVYRNWSAMQLTPDEADEFRVLVRQARAAGWKDAELAQRLGFQSAHKLDQVMKRRKSALGEHLRTLRQVVSSKEDPPKSQQVAPGSYQPQGKRRPAPQRPTSEVADAPAQPTGDVAAAHTLDTPAPATPGPDDPLTEDEHLEFMELVEILDSRGWPRSEASLRIGFKSPTGIPSAMAGDPERRPARARLVELRAFVAANLPAPPPRGGAPRGPKYQKSTVTGGTEYCTHGVFMGHKCEACDEAGGARVASIVVPKLRTPKVSAAAPAAPPAPEPAPARAQEPTVHQPPASPRPRTPDSLTVLDHLGRAVSALERARKEVQDAQREAQNAAAKGNKWIKAGIEANLPAFAPVCQALDKLVAELTLE